ncbi:MAG: potassium transporter TrkG [Nitriliruptorales bacterium]|nr:potassium transporter TrkG [Nitriliruptorales bacterium]
MRTETSREQIRTVVSIQGQLLGILGALAMAVAPVAVVAGEWNALSALLITAAIGLGAGLTARRRLLARRDLTWSEGMVVLGLAYPVMSVLAAVPFAMSGHAGSWGDAFLEAMSGLTTTGLSVLHDIDHLPHAVAAWRQSIQIIGAITILIAGLTVFTPRSQKASNLYGAGVRLERSVPGFVTTFRHMVKVGVAWTIAGGVALSLALAVAGVPLLRIPFHAMALFTSAFSTGGFSVSSASVASYHSWSIELVLIVLMLAGAIAFPLHILLWRGEVRRAVRHVDTRSLAVVFSTALVVVLVGLGRSGAFTDALPLLRRGLFQVVSAQTTTGLTVVEPRVLASDWGLIAPAGLVLAMAIGGMRRSTAGGVKAERFGLIFRGIFREMRRVLLPDHALVVETYQHKGRPRILTDAHIRAVGTMLLLFMTTHLVGALVILYGADSFDLTEAMFESVSATSNVGMSIGILGPMSSGILKTVVVLQMWLGRLEFMAVFALAGFLWSIRRLPARSTA